jgi:hypothetical protein
MEISWSVRGFCSIIVSRLMRGESGDKGSGAEGDREKPVPPAFLRLNIEEPLVPDNPDISPT